MKIFRIGIVGDFQSGKSTLINCLLGRPIATIGDGTPTTHSIVNYLYGEEERLECIDVSGNIVRSSLNDLERIEMSKQINQINVFVASSLLHDFVLTDMPGFGNDKRDNFLAEISISNIDFAIVLTRNEKSGEEESNLYKDVVRLKKHRIPYYLIMNCTNFFTWSPCNPDNERIAYRNRSLFSFYNPLTYPFEKGQTLSVNLMWYWFSICSNDDPIIKRYQTLYDHITSKTTLQDIKIKSNFHLITKIFSMDNRAFLELRNSIKEEIKELKKELCPIGTIQAFAFESIPQGWLLCNGQALKKEEYPELYSVIGVTFGEKGKTKFKIPDLRSKFVRGWDERNRKFGSDQEDALQGHSHVFHLDIIKMELDGQHDHDLYWGKFNVRDPSINSANNHEQLIPVPYANRQESRYGRIGSDFWTKDGSVIEGKHSHKILIDGDKELIGNPIDSNYSSMNNKVDTETRPKNIALSYCIKVKH